MSRSSLWRNATHALGTSVVSVPIGLLTSILVTRALGAEGRGVYSLVLATATFLATTLGLSLPAGITYVVARAGANLRALGAQLLVIATVIGGFASAFLAIVRETRVAGYFLPSEGGTWIVAAITGWVFFLTLSLFARAVLVGRQEIVRANRRDFLNRVLEAAAVALAVAWCSISFGRVPVAAVVGASLLACAVTALSFVHAVGVPPKTSGPSQLGEVFRISLPSHGANILQYLNYRLDIFVVSYFAGAAATGVYTLAVSVIQLLWLASNAVAYVLLPRVAASWQVDSAVVETCARVNRLSLASTALLALGAALLAPWVFPLVFGSDFAASVGPLWLLLPGATIFSAANVLASYFAGTGRPRVNLHSSALGFVFTIVLDFALIPRYGAAGAAVASTFSYAASAVYLIARFSADAKISPAKACIVQRDDIRMVLERVRATFENVRMQRAASRTAGVEG